MAFEKPVPEWLEKGSEPPESLKRNGWSPEDKPAAQHFNYMMNKLSEATKELQEGAAESKDLIQAEERLSQQLSKTTEDVKAVSEIKDTTTDTIFSVNFFVHDGHLGFKLPQRKVPGGDNLLAGTNERGYHGLVPYRDFGTVYTKTGAALPFNGATLAQAIGLDTIHGQSLWHDTPWLKFAWKGKTLFYPQKSIWYKVTWEEVYKAGTVYGDDTVGFLPPSGMIGYKDNPLRIDAVAGQIRGRGFTFDFEEEGWFHRFRVGDKIRLAGWVNDGNNGVFTITSLTDTVITVAEKTRLANEVGNIQTARFWRVEDEVLQNATVEIEGYLYRVRMMRGGNKPVTIKGDASSFAINAFDSPINENEYAHLFLSTHQKAGTNLWDYSHITDENHSHSGTHENIVGNDPKDFVGITPNFGTNFTSRQLGVEQGRHFVTPREDPRDGNGTHVWFEDSACREAVSPNERLARGDSDGSNIHGHYVTAYSENMGYRPVLELIGKA